MNTINRATTNQLNTLAARPSNWPPLARPGYGVKLKLDVFNPYDSYNSRPPVDSGDVDRLSKYKNFAAGAMVVSIGALPGASLGFEHFGPVGAAVGGCIGGVICLLAILTPTSAP